MGSGQLPNPAGEREAVKPVFVNGFDELVQNHTVNVIVGAVCACINIPLLIVFLTHRPLRQRHKILIALAFADFINCIAIMTMGINRVALYSQALATLTIPIRNSWDCAVEPWLWLRGIGDLWPPVIQLLMGLERVVAVYKPVYFKSKSKRRSLWTISCSILFVAASLSAGFIMAWMNRAAKVKYYCGRKAAFSNGYGTYIYTTNVVGYACGFLLNCAAYCKVRTFTSKNDKNRNMARLRYCIAISFLSTVLVSIPNLISLTSVLFEKVSDAISKPAVWATCINSGLNFFVYFALNLEFRQRVVRLIGRGRPYDRTTTITTSSVSQTNTRTISLATTSTY